MFARVIKVRDSQSKGSRVSWHEHRASDQETEFDPSPTFLCTLKPVMQPHFTEEETEALRDLQQLTR